VWCRVSRSDEDVIDEASFAKKRGIKLLPVKLDDVDPPLGKGSHGAETRGSSVLDVAQGMGLRAVEKFGSHAGQPGHRHGVH
jgi:hypothetical protein